MFPFTSTYNGYSPTCPHAVSTEPPNVSKHFDNQRVKSLDESEPNGWYNSLFERGEHKVVKRELGLNTLVGIESTIMR